VVTPFVRVDGNGAPFLRERADPCRRTSTTLEKAAGGYNGSDASTVAALFKITGATERRASWPE
jgi:hypothetical protein